MAAVLCASLSRRAMVCRSLVMRTRSSRAASSGNEGARTWMVAAGCAIGVGAAAARSIAAIMSPLVTRPSLPVPGTPPASMPVSSAILRTEGASASAAAGLGAAGLGCGGAWGATFAAAGAALGGAGAALAGAPPSWICPSKAPGATISPSLARISASTPDAGAGTSTVTLSVSSSTTGSSAATASPGCLNQRPMVASVTDSPSVGTRISVVMIVSLVTAASVQERPNHSRGPMAGFQPSASSSRLRSWAWCLDIVPVAVAAEAGRPA